MRIEPYLAWVSIRALGVIYDATFEETKHRFTLAFGCDPFVMALSHTGEPDLFQPLQRSQSQLLQRFWKVLTWALCQRFAYLMGKISKYDLGVRRYFEYAEMDGLDIGEMLLGFLQQATMMTYYQPGGIEPAVQDIANGFSPIGHQDITSLWQQRQALRDQSARNTQRLEELQRELQRCLDRAPCMELLSSYSFV